MKKYLINLVILLCIASQAISQSIRTYDYYADGGGGISGNTLKVVCPAGYPPYLPSGSWYIYNPTSGGRIAQARASIFLEYADGTYTTFDSATHTYRMTPSKPALLSLRGKYDTIHPHLSIIAQKIIPSVVNSSGTQQLLPSGKNIALVSEVGDLIANDTIQTVITFKKTFRGKGKILFYYNAGLQAFKGISQNNNDTIRVLPWSETINAVRTYEMTLPPDLQNTNPSSADAQYGQPPLSSPSLAFKYINNGNIAGGTTNVLVFTLPETFDRTSEHNIFITLVTGGNSIYTSTLSATSINAYILEDTMHLNPDSLTRSRQLNSQSANLEFPIAQGDPNNTNPDFIRPHDPNFIIADKKCTNYCRPSPPSQPFKYRVHFQNDGIKFADTIIVTVFLDKKLDTTKFRNLSANVAGREIKGRNFKVSSFEKQGDWNKVVFTLLTAIPTDGSVNLFGTKGLAMPETDTRTMGDVRFSIMSLAGALPSYFSIASIVFNSELPVVTRMNRIRCCDKMPGSVDPIPERPFGKKGKIVKEGPPKLIDKKREGVNLRSNG